MGYRTRTSRQKFSRRTLRNVVLLAFCLLIAALCIFSAFVPTETWKYHFSLPKVASIEAGETRVHYLDVGNGDCTLVELPDGKTVMVGGGPDDGAARKNIFRFLNALKIKKIDVLVVPDASLKGVGSLRQLVKYYTVNAVYLPVGGGSNGMYNSFVADLQREKISAYDAKFGLLLEGEGYSLRVLYPLESDYSTQQTVLTLSCGGVEVLLGAGYNEEVYRALQTEQQLGLLEKWGVDIERFDVVQVGLKVDAEAVADFVSAFDCGLAVFSCSGGASYSPKEEVLDGLSEAGVEIARTDANGRISVTIKDGVYTVAKEK